MTENAASAPPNAPSDAPRPPNADAPPDRHAHAREEERPHGGDHGHGHAHDHGHAHGHGHGHDHAHGHGGHHHHHGENSSARALLIAACLTGGFMIAEVAGGLISGSLALLADAGHMATDFISLLLAWAGLRLAARPADPQRSYGWRRLPVLAAFANGLALVAVALWILVEAVQRLADPAPVLGGVMLWVAVGGLAVNILAFAVLQAGDRSSLNLRAAALHVAADLLGSVAAILAALLILWTGWTPIDPILSALAAALILRSAVQIIRASAHILLQGAPEGIEADAVLEAVSGIAGVTRAHHLHLWSLDERRAMATLHVVAAPGHGPELAEAVRARLRGMGIAHATVEVEPAPAG